MKKLYLRVNRISERTYTVNYGYSGRAQYFGAYDRAGLKGMLRLILAHAKEGRS